jgi:hypothetical protein
MGREQREVSPNKDGISILNEIDSETLLNIVEKSRDNKSGAGLIDLISSKTRK